MPYDYKIIQQHEPGMLNPTYRSSCKICGAVVEQPGKHVDWHNKHFFWKPLRWKLNAWRQGRKK